MKNGQNLDPKEPFVSQLIGINIRRGKHTNSVQFHSTALGLGLHQECSESACARGCEGVLPCLAGSGNDQQHHRPNQAEAPLKMF
ncbi:hypothetical protein AGOR_G00028820 [Albula goreensis]|uniref:Uncharacterized protein n=1 Tax=Albula goreensis TaxID=1534307 RepID=A0A8T3E9H3_9TELE|nr:hypothetical protein AGOR_G00028820 [Albula goreensis]